MTITMVSSKYPHKLIKHLENTYEAKVNKVGDTGWENGCMGKGARNYVPGINAGVEEWKKFFTVFREHLAAGQASIDAMDTSTFEAAKLKMIAQVDHNHAFKYEG